MNYNEIIFFFHKVVSVFFPQLYLWCSSRALPAFSSTVIQSCVIEHACVGIAEHKNMPMLSISTAYVNFKIVFQLSTLNFYFVQFSLHLTNHKPPPKRQDDAKAKRGGDLQAISGKANKQINKNPQQIGQPRTDMAKNTSQFGKPKSFISAHHIKGIICSLSCPCSQTGDWQVLMHRQMDFTAACRAQR